MLSLFFSSIWQEAMDRNAKNIVTLLAKNPEAHVVAMGCGDGKLTIRILLRLR